MNSALSDHERFLVAQRVEDFRSTRSQGPVPDWEPFLEELLERLRRIVLADLIVIDLTQRWDEGEKVTIEEYGRRFPEVTPADRMPAVVIVEEFRCRRKAGEDYDPLQYKARFPIQYPEIRDRLEALAQPFANHAASTFTDTLVGSAPSSAPNSPAPRPSRSHSPDTLTGEYDCIRRLGRGVFGEVWLARKRTSGIDKALKILSHPIQKDAAQRELRSLELIKNLRHPYLLSTDDFWVSDERLHIVMELADCTLRNRMDQCRDEGRPGIPEGELISYIREAAEGLDFLHSKHVVHRDVKPDNILILNGHAKVADFGLAWQQDQSIGAMKTFAGTPAYMAPEVWGREGGPASDQYSLAVAYTELRQGHPPLHGQQLDDMMSAHLGGSHVFEPVIQDSERAVLVRAMARSPADRYPSCSAFVEDLARAIGAPGSFRPASSQGLAASAPSSPTVANTGVHTQGPSSPTDATMVKSRKSVAETDTHSPTLISSTSPLAGTSPAPSTSHKMKWIAAAAAAIAAVGLGVWAMGNRGRSVGPDGNGSTPDGSAPDNGAVAATGPVLPPRAVAATGARVEELADHRHVYDIIIIPVGSESVQFRLISGGQPPRLVSPFYIMESKVWNGLYRTGKAMLPAASEANGADAPVTSVTADEAMAFARDVLGGKLPSPLEWDLAAGLYHEHKRDEVTQPGGDPRVLKARPLPTHGPNAGTDVNRFGLRDMAGNGREWTRAVLLASGEVRDAGDGPVAPTDRVILRGRNFTLSRGLTFGILEYEQTTPQTQLAGARSPYTSFRAVVEVNR